MEQESFTHNPADFRATRRPMNVTSYSLLNANTPKQRREERRKVLRVSAVKIKSIDDPEAFLMRSVLINNTFSRLRQELRDEKSRASSRKCNQVIQKPMEPVNTAQEPCDSAAEPPTKRRNVESHYNAASDNASKDSIAQITRRCDDFDKQELVKEHTSCGNSPVIMEPMDTADECIDVITLDNGQDAKYLYTSPSRASSCAQEVKKGPSDISNLNCSAEGHAISEGQVLDDMLNTLYNAVSEIVTPC